MQVPGFEPGCLAWKAKILTTRLHLQRRPLSAFYLKNLFVWNGSNRLPGKSGKLPLGRLSAWPIRNAEDRIRQNDNEEMLQRGDEVD